MRNEIDIFKNTEIKSFGGSSLQENLKKAEIIVEQLSDDFRIHNHSNTQFSWNHFVLSHKGGLRNARQITAEINKKTIALHEAKHRHKKKIIQIEMLQGQAGKYHKENSSAEKKMLHAEIEQLEDELKISLAPIEGAIKDILTLKHAYDEITQGRSYSEADLEQEEIGYWIRRLFSQALRDMRQSGTIMNGNQEAIEQIGLNLSVVFNDLTIYLKREGKDTELGNGELMKFLERSVEKYQDTVNSFIGYARVNGDIFGASIF